MMKHLLFLFISLLLITGCQKGNGQETVTITGRVTDFEGHPIDSCRIW